MVGKVKIYTFLIENLKFKSIRYLDILRNYPFRLLITTYLFLSMILARLRIFDNNSLLVTLFILPSIILVPLLIGKLTLTIVLRNRKQNLIPLNALSFIIISWITGLLIIFITASMLFTVGMLFSNIYTLVIFCISIAANLLLKNVTFTQPLNKKTLNAIFGDPRILFVLPLAGVLPLLYIIPRSPFPLTFNATYVWFLNALEFRDINYIELAGGNVPVLSTFFGVLSTIYEVHPLSIYSGTNYLGHILYPIFIYVLCYRLTKRIGISLFSSMIAPWVYQGITLLVLEDRSLCFQIFPLLLYLAFDYFERQPEDSQHFFFKHLILPFAFVLIPISLLVSLGPKAPYLFRIFVLIFLPTFLICSTYFIRDENKKLFFLYFILPLIGIAIIHQAELLLISIFLASFALSKILIDKNKLAFVKIVVFIFFVFVQITVKNILPFSFPDNFVLTRWRYGSLLNGVHPFDLNPAQRYDLLKFLGPELVFQLFIISIPVTTLLAKSKGERNGIIPFTFMCSFITLITFLPDGLVGWRATMYWNICYAIMCSLLLFLPFHTLIKFFRKKCKLLDFRKTPFIKVTYFFLLILLLFPSFQSARINYLNNFAKSNPNGYLSYIQPYEVEAAFWIYKNTAHDVIIVSDPHTMLILKCLTTQDTLLGEYVYIFDKEYSKETITKMNLLREKVFMAKSSEQLYSEIRKILGSYYNNKEIFIIISPRTLTWIKTGEMFPVYIEETNVKEILGVLFNNKLFSLIFYDTNMELYIYKLI